MDNGQLAKLSSSSPVGSRHFWHRTWLKFLVFSELLGLDTKTTTRRTRCAERQNCCSCANCATATATVSMEMQTGLACSNSSSSTTAAAAAGGLRDTSIRYKMLARRCNRRRQLSTSPSPLLYLSPSVSPSRLSAIVIIDLWQDDWWSDRAMQQRQPGMEIYERFA